MSEAWLAFARCGSPGWPAYELKSRSTMIFNVHSAVVDDPRKAEREMLAALPAIKHLG